MRGNNRDMEPSGSAADAERGSDADRLLTLLAPIHERARMSARRLCRSEAEGDDLFQEAALRALRKLPSLRDDQAFPAWFYRILLSLNKNRARARFWRRLSPLEVLAHTGEPAGDDGARWEEARHGARRLREALDSLPLVQREAIVLFDIDGYSLEEVARMQEASLSAVKSRLQRGRARLRRFYRRRGYGVTGERPDPWPSAAAMAEERNAS